MTSGDFDFFGGPTSPPPSGPPSGAPFGAPVGGAPVVNQFGLPAAPAPAVPVGLPPGAHTTGSDNGRRLAVLAALVAAVVLAVGGFVWLQAQGKKTATKVATSVETPLVKAHQMAETADLQQAAQGEETYLADHSAYATSTSELTGFVSSPTTTVTVVSATATTYCLRADDTSTFHAPSMYVSSTVQGASTTPCT